jgi:hypothetical protein
MYLGELPFGGLDMCLDMRLWKGGAVHRRTIAVLVVRISVESSSLSSLLKISGCAIRYTRGAPWLPEVYRLHQPFELLQPPLRLLLLASRFDISVRGI